MQTQVTNLDPSGSVSRSVIDAKGDLIVGSANDAIDNLALGSNGQVLTVDTAQTLGMKWAAPAVTTSNAITLTNKTVAYDSNTLTGVASELLVLIGAL